MSTDLLIEANEKIIEDLRYWLQVRVCSPKQREDWELKLKGRIETLEMLKVEEDRIARGVGIIL